MAGIGTLRETGLHADLKAWYARPGDTAETTVDGFVVDLLRGVTVIEIQTGHFYAIKAKLEKLLARGPVRLVHPIATERWIVRLDADRKTRLSRRKSPRRGCSAQIFAQLVSFPELLGHPNFSLDVLLTREEELHCAWPRPKRGRRRQSRLLDRRLIDVTGNLLLEGPADCLALLPAGLPQPFTNRELGRAMRQPAVLAAQMTYCLRRMGLLAPAGKRGRAVLHAVAWEAYLRG
jgi:hypothetical protein